MEMVCGITKHHCNQGDWSEAAANIFVCQDDFSWRGCILPPKNSWLISIGWETVCSAIYTNEGKLYSNVIRHFRFVPNSRCLLEFHVLKIPIVGQSWLYYGMKSFQYRTSHGRLPSIPDDITTILRNMIVTRVCIRMAITACQRINEFRVTDAGRVKWSSWRWWEWCFLWYFDSPCCTTLCPLFRYMNRTP